MELFGPTLQQKEKAVIDNYNSKLQARVAALAATNVDVRLRPPLVLSSSEAKPSQSNPPTRVWFYNANARLTQILDSPQTYGFSNATWVS